jgi:ATP-dependent Lhr-like helicase
MWEISEIVDDEVKVMPIQRSGEIPSWTGEEIPVPFDVAQEVGQMRKEIREALESQAQSQSQSQSQGEEAAVDLLVGKYPVDYEAAAELVGLIKKQMDENLAVPDDSHVIVEASGPTAIINACFGHKTNDTLGRALTSLLSARFGSSVALEIDPYRIELELPKAMLAEEKEDAG